VALGLLSLKTYINSIGLYNTKAEHIIKLCEQVIRLHAGQVPETRMELEALPGVGRKTANVILNTAFGQPTIAVDTHIFRVANRTKIAIGKNVTVVEQNLDKTVPKAHKLNAHHLLILHGRYTCIARKPRCQSCVIEDLCEFDGKLIE
jgi:endonuclease-3